MLPYCVRQILICRPQNEMTDPIGLGTHELQLACRRSPTRATLFLKYRRASRNVKPRQAMHRTVTMTPYSRADRNRTGYLSCSFSNENAELTKAYSYMVSFADTNQSNFVVIKLIGRCRFGNRVNDRPEVPVGQHAGGIHSFDHRTPLPGVPGRGCRQRLFPPAAAANRNHRPRRFFDMRAGDSRDRCRAARSASGPSWSRSSR